MIGDNGITTWPTLIAALAFAASVAAWAYVLLKLSRNRKDKRDS